LDRVHCERNEKGGGVRTEKECKKEEGTIRRKWTSGKRNEEDGQREREQCKGSK